MTETQLEIQHQAKYTTKMKKPNDEKGLYYQVPEIHYN